MFVLVKAHVSDNRTSLVLILICDIQYCISGLSSLSAAKSSIHHGNVLNIFQYNWAKSNSPVCKSLRFSVYQRHYVTPFKNFDFV